MSQKAAQAHVIASGADPTSSEPLYAALSRAEAARTACGSSRAIRACEGAEWRRIGGARGCSAWHQSAWLALCRLLALGCRLLHAPAADSSRARARDRVATAQGTACHRLRSVTAALSGVADGRRLSASTETTGRHVAETEVQGVCRHSQRAKCAAEEASTDAPDKCR
eukprot:27280_1